jgi:hypothetical protein
VLELVTMVNGLSGEMLPLMILEKALNEGIPFVIRLYSTGSIEKKFEYDDLIKGGVLFRK